MAIIKGYERKKFDKQHEAMRKEYLEAGMTEAQIGEIFQLDLDQFNRDYAFMSRVQPLYYEDDFDPDAQNPLLSKYEGRLSYWDIMPEGICEWLDNITQEPLASEIQKLSDDQKFLLTLLYKYEYSQIEIAREYHINPKTLSVRCNKILDALRNCTVSGLFPNSKEKALLKGGVA